MSFDDRFLDDLKSRFVLSDYVGRTVPLKRSGREFVGLSPFVREKTPSFFVNDQKRFFHDFASGKHGDIIDFVQLTEGRDFVETVKVLAEEAGLPLPERDGPSAEAERRRRALEDWLHQARLWFKSELQRPAAADARAYLERRGLTPDDWERFGIGYAPADRGGLRQHLLGKGAKIEQLVEAGLLVTPDAGQPYDRYRHRIMFPIHSVSGRLISFGARALDPNAKAKYLNGPDSPLFDKSQHLYGLDMARKGLAGAEGPLVVVEGYMDVIACIKAGISSCAPMGTSLTTAQLELMWKVHPEPTLCFDADAAGRRAANRAMDVALPKIGAQRSLRFMFVTGGKDADQVLREQGPGVLRSQVSKATPMVEAIFQRELTAGPLETPEQRTGLRDRLRKIVDAISDRGLRGEYGVAIRDRLAEMRKPANQRPASTEGVEAAKALRAAVTPLVSAMAYWTVKDPARVGDLFETLEATGFGHAALDRMAREIVSWLMDGETDPEQLAQRLHARGLSAVVDQLSDPGDRLADKATWTRIYSAFAHWVSLERAVQQAKAAISTPAEMEKFMALKAQRDDAKRGMIL